MKYKTKLISLIFLSLGILFLLQISLPLIKFRIWEISLNKSVLPLTSPQTEKVQVLGVSIKSSDNFPAFISDLKRETPTSYQQFRLSVPKLNLEEIPVLVDSNDLSKGLVHLPGSSLPGEKGNVFISGHSALPLPFLKKDNIFFDKLSDLKKDDLIFVSALGTEFKYKVISIKIVSPQDTSVILPPDSKDRYVTLMTCVPPGLNTKRLVVLAKLI